MIASGHRELLAIYIRANLGFICEHPQHIHAVIQIAANARADENTTAGTGQAVPLLVRELREDQSGGDFRDFDPLVMAVSLRAAIDAAAPGTESSEPTEPVSTGSFARTRKTVIISLGLDLVAPLAVFYGLRAVGVSAWGSLLASAVVPILVVIGRFSRYRTMDFGALFVLTLLALGLALSTLTGSPRALLVRDAWLGMAGRVAGVWLIGSAFSGRPGLCVLFRSFVLAKAGPQGLAAWEGRWDGDEPDFRRNLRLLTVVWGGALLLSAVAQLVVAYAAPIDVAPAAMNVVWPVIALPLWTFHIVFTKRRDLRA